MAWKPFQPARPATGNGRTRQEQYNDIRENLLALAAMIAAGNDPFGWDRTQTDTGDPGKPDTKTYAQGTLRIRLTHTYGSTGGAAGNIVKTVFEYSDDDGVNFEPLTDYLGNYVKTIGYHATRFIALTDTWSNIP